MRVQPGRKWTQFGGDKKIRPANETLAGGRLLLPVFIVLVIALFNIALVGATTHAIAQENDLLASGDAAITGFSTAHR